MGMGTGMGMAVPLWAWLRADSAIHAPAPRSRAKALRSTLRIASVAAGVTPCGTATVEGAEDKAAAQRGRQYSGGGSTVKCEAACPTS